MQIPIVETSQLGKLVKYARSPLGWLLGAILALNGILAIVLYSSVGVVAKYIVIGIVLLLFVVILIFVLKRIPKEEHGLTATDDYYLLKEFLDHLETYGSDSHRRTRKEALETGEKVTAGTVLPSPPPPPQLPKGGG